MQHSQPRLNPKVRSFRNSSRNPCHLACGLSTNTPHLRHCTHGSGVVHELVVTIHPRCCSRIANCHGAGQASPNVAGQALQPGRVFAFSMVAVSSRHLQCSSPMHVIRPVRPYTQPLGQRKPLPFLQPVHQHMCTLTQRSS